MPIKIMDYHEILDEHECVSCGAPDGRVIYYRKDSFYWELAEETKDGKKPEYTPQRSCEDRRDEGLHLQTVLIDDGMCRNCIRLEASVRFRGVGSWKAYKRRKDGSTYAIPHSSEYARAKALNFQEKCGVKEIPEW